MEKKKGESNLYFEDGFVGKSILDATSTSRYFWRSQWEEIGSIVIERRRWKEFSQKRNMGSNITEPRNMKSVRINKITACSLNVTDQIPDLQ